MTLEELGYGNDDVYDKIRERIRQSPIFRFDWFIKSRTSIEIQRRCATLIGIVQKEMNEFDDDSETKKRPKSSEGHKKRKI